MNIWQGCVVPVRPPQLKEPVLTELTPGEKKIIEEKITTTRKIQSENFMHEI